MHRARPAHLVLLVLPFLLGGFLLGRASAGDGYRLFQSVFSLVAREAVDSLDVDELYEQAARGLVAKLGDPYADLQDAGTYERFSRNTLGNRYGGIGLRIVEFAGALAVLRVIPGGAAEEANIRPGDRIIAVNDSLTTGWSVERASRTLTGPPGTTVKITIQRADPSTRLVRSLTRRVITPHAIPFTTLLPGGIGYIPLERFSDHSGGEVAESADRLAKAGAKALLLDLRGNPGGELDQAVAVASVFLDSGQTVVRVQYRRFADTLRATISRLVPPDLPIAVLVDSESASASEIVAGALQDYDRALLVGTVSYGKGLVQGVYRLPGDWRLKITNGHWYTPSGRLIQRALNDSLRRLPRPIFHSAGGRRLWGGGGIVPDVAVDATNPSGPERSLAELLGQRAGVANAILDSLGIELEPATKPGFSIPPAWRSRLLSRLRAAGFVVPDSLADQDGGYLERLIENRAGIFALSDSASFVRNAVRDAQLNRALELLTKARNQHELLAEASEPGRQG
jgi:carboxyl-terminal processing protease